MNQYQSVLFNKWTLNCDKKYERHEQYELLLTVCFSLQVHLELSSETFETDNKILLNVTFKKMSAEEGFEQVRCHSCLKQK